ncbi:amidohydrolase family protein [Novosphingobium terrae]|uniref:amidohydrolase family protein n=1 Tax=Novosphingobium terrae TaxID=2726189 RepID=UPI001F136A11|nr:amidohydrolase family protein [Novosphingobium terrae]
MTLHTPTPGTISRRGAAHLLATAAFTAMMPVDSAAAQGGGQPSAPARRIDLHHHFLPDFYREALAKADLLKADGIPGTPAWSEAAMIAMMDDLGIDKAIISVSSPGVHFGDDAAARALARRVNEEGARLAAAHRGRIGFFASTPLPDVAGAVEEVTYALDHLGAAGVIFETNFHGVYLGDAQLAPVYAELDKRKAVLFIHPTSPDTSCGCAAGGQDLGLGYPAPLIEFIFDTTRSVTNMVLSGTFARYPNIRLLVPHAGAALPILAGRIDAIAGMLAQGARHAPPPAMHEALRRMHFDLAGMPVPHMLSTLLAVADHSRIHYGSDWPYTPVPACHALAAALEQTPLLSPQLRNAIMAGNAEALIGKTP